MSFGRRNFLKGSLLAAFLVPAVIEQAVASGAGHQKPATHHRPAGKKPLKPLVMIDPGHGGKDPGAIGVSGTYEKRVALAAATQLKKRLEATGRYRARLTRGRDTFLPLAHRVALAERHGAALFVSVHADSLTTHKVRGGSVYTFSATASDALAGVLAKRENSADRFGTGHWHSVTPEVRQILGSLVVQETKVGSVTMQELMLSSLKPKILLLQNPARHARFAVLKSPSIPSVLIEMGFMSNRLDERLLRQPRHRVMITTAMTGAIDHYFKTARNAHLFTG